MLGCMKAPSSLVGGRLIPSLAGLALAGAAISTPVPAEAIGWTAAYYGETVTHPGLMLGAEHRLAPLAGGQLLAAGHLGYYVHPGYTQALFARSELALRWPLAGAFDLEAAAGLGLLHSRVAGDLYVVGPSGAPERAFDLGSPALMPSLALGLGRNWEGYGRSFGRLEVFGQYPYNGYVLPHVALSIGWSWGTP